MRYARSMPAALLSALLSAGGAGAEEATIVIESGTVRADDFSFDVRLDTDVPVSGTLNDIVFDTPALIGVRANGKPQCSVNPDIDKGASGFAFHPNGCVPGESCTTVRALILSIENVDPIASGGVLYTCRLAPGLPPGRYPLHCANPKAADFAGAEVAAACVDGEIEVTASTVLLAGTDFVRPGETALIGVSLFSTEDAVGITTDLSIATLPIRGVSAPACVAAGDDVDATFAYRPDGCTPGADCTGVHAVVASRTGAALANGAVLFTCGVDVPVTTASGEYVVDLHDAAGTTAGGGAATVSLNDGGVRVDGPPITPTVPGETPMPAHSRLEIGSASAAPRSGVQIAVTLHTDEIISGV